MKTFFFLFLLFSQALYSQDAEIKAVSSTFDSLAIKKSVEIIENEKLMRMSADLFNSLILNDNFKNKEFYSSSIKQFNKAQTLYVLEPIYKSASELERAKVAFDKILQLRNAGIKAKLIIAHLSEKSDNMILEENKRVLRFLRETNYSASQFSALTAEQQDELLINFENQKNGFTPEISEISALLSAEEVSRITEGRITQRYCSAFDKNIRSVFTKLEGRDIFVEDYPGSGCRILTKKGAVLFQYLKK